MSEKRLAIVTGGARGIGRAIVIELLKQGREVVAMDIMPDQLAELEKIVAEEGFSVITKCLDITKTDELTETIESLAKEYGGIGILVNNAGITRDKLMMQMSAEDFDTERISILREIERYNSLAADISDICGTENKFEDLSKLSKHVKRKLGVKVDKVLLRFVSNIAHFRYGHQILFEPTLVDEGKKFFEPFS